MVRAMPKAYISPMLLVARPREAERRDKTMPSRKRTAPAPVGLRARIRDGRAV